MNPELKQLKDNLDFLCEESKWNYKALSELLEINLDDLNNLNLSANEIDKLSYLFCVDAYDLMCTPITELNDLVIRWNDSYSKKTVQSILEFYKIIRNYQMMYKELSDSSISY